MSFWKKLFGREEAKRDLEFQKEIFDKFQDDSYAESLFSAVSEFILASTTWDIEGSLYRHPELLSREADHLMQILEDRASDDQQHRLGLQIRRALLARYRVLGTATDGAVLKERDLKSLDTLNAAVLKDFTHTLNNLFNLPDRQWASFIKQHMELLSPPVDDIIRLNVETEKNAERKKKIAECQSLFTLCRQVGIDQAFTEKEKQTLNGIRRSSNQLIQELYEMGFIDSSEPVPGVVDEFGFKPLDYPKKFEEDLMKANLLEMVWKQDPQSMIPLTAIYESILERETLDEYQEFFAGIHFNLGNLYGQLPFGNMGDSLTRAIQHYEKALSFYTEENSPDDYASIMSSLGIIHAKLSRGRDTNPG